VQEQNQNIKEIESIINQVQGVISGRLICQNNDIVEIHVLADSSRAPKQVVRDIESAVLVKIGLELDHKIISVAQLGDDVTSPPGSDGRLQLSYINFSIKKGTATITITINSGDDHYTATTTGPNAKFNRLRLTSSATLSAVEKSKNISGNLVVGDVQKIILCEHEIIAVAIFFQANNKEEILLGTAINKGDDLESTVRATLDALNRKVSGLERIKV